MPNFRHLFAAMAAILIASFATAATAQTYTVTRSFSGDGVTGTATLVLDDATAAPDYLYSDTTNLPAELISADLQFSGLSGRSPVTSFNRSQLRGLRFTRDGSGAITDVNFWADANPDGYSLTGVINFVTDIGETSTVQRVTNTAAVAPTPAPIPTMTEWAMIFLAVLLAGGAAVYLTRRRQLV